MEKHRLGPVLVGMRGSGKSSIAPLVAERLGMQAVDADAELERQTGRSIPRIFAEDGEAGFRRIERALLLDDLLQRGDTVVATGGGAVLDADIRAELAQRMTVWLDAPVGCLAERIGGSDRPSLTGKPIGEELAEILTRRETLYREVASVVIDTQTLVPQQVAQAICERIADQMKD